MTPREGGTAAAGHTKLQLHYCIPILYCTNVGPKRHQGHRRTRGGIEIDTRAGPEGPEGTRGDPRDTRRTGGHTGTGDVRGNRRTVLSRYVLYM